MRPEVSKYMLAVWYTNRLLYICIINLLLLRIYPSIRKVVMVHERFLPIPLSLSWHNTCEVNSARLKCTLAHFPASPPTPLAAKLGKSPTTSSSKAGNDESIQCLEDGTLTIGRKKHPCLKDSLTEVKLGTNPDHLTWASFALNFYTSYKGHENN